MNEYENMNLKPDPVEMLSMEFGLWNSIYVLIGLFVGYRILALILLAISRNKLQ